MAIEIALAQQTLTLHQSDGTTITYPVSTSANGAGERNGSQCTPRGSHIIRARIGAGQPNGAVFRGRRYTGEVYTPELAAQQPGRNWILSRILWLSGREPGFNRLGAVDSMRRFIYIHGTPEASFRDRTGSHGCICMRNADVIDLFDRVEAGCPVRIQE